MLLKALILLATIYAIASQTPTTYVYKTIGNLSILADVYLPNSSNYTKYPVFFCVHGGGFIVGSKNGAFTGEEFTQVMGMGWSIVSIDYRLNPGVFIPDIIADIQDAYNWIRTDLAQNVSIDPDNVIVFGESAGGGLAVMMGYKLSPPPKAVISFYPYCTNFMTNYDYNPLTTIPEEVYEEAEEYFYPIITEYIVNATNDARSNFFFNILNAEKAGWALTTHNTHKSPTEILYILSQYSSILHVTPNYPPTYIAHGLDDSLVPYNQSVEMAGALSAANVEHHLALIPGQGHNFDYNCTPQQWEEYILPAFYFAEEYVTTEKVDNILIE